jgi:glycosyltransferase involved in cell wall biosynthesis
VQLFDGWEPDELRELVACADVVIAPSLAEGFGSVHSEACAMGKPLITTQVAAIPEVVSGHIVFVQAGSSEAIIQGIQKVRTGAGERIMQKHFDWDETIEKIETLYHLG